VWGLCGISLGGRSPGRADSAWGYRVDAGLDPGTGKRRQIWKQGCKNKREAETALNSVLKGLEEGSTRCSTMTVGNFLDDCLLVQKHRIRPTTWHGYEMRWSESSDISARRSAKRCHLCRSRRSIRCCSSRCEQAGRFGSGSMPVAGDDVMHSVVVGLAARPTGSRLPITDRTGQVFEVAERTADVAGVWREVAEVDLDTASMVVAVMG
jgi:hypothetical protein